MEEKIKKAADAFALAVTSKKVAAAAVAEAEHTLACAKSVLSLRAEGAQAAWQALREAAGEGDL